MRLRSVVYMFAFGAAVMANDAIGQEHGFEVKCEPTELSDIARVIRYKIYKDLEPDKTIKERIIEAKVITRDKNQTVKSNAQLLAGTGFFFDPQTLEIAIGGASEGHACFATADVRIHVKIKRKDGTQMENTVVSTLLIPGAVATKAKVIVNTPAP